MKGYLLPAALLCGLLLLQPAAAAAGATEGLTLVIRVLLPSLFPFMVLTDLICTAGGSGRLLSFLLSFAGGYPTGARAVCRLYTAGCISRPEAEWRLGFCSNCGISFLLGALGGGLFGDVRLGLLLLLIEAAAAAFSALLLRPRRLTAAAGYTPTAAPSFPAALRRALTAMATVGGTVVFISALLGALRALLPPLPPTASALLSGLCELSLGTAAAAGLPGGFVLCAAISAFGGLCVHLQCLDFITSAGLSCGKYFAGKGLQGILSALLAWIFSLCW
ncbi:MAG: hypothetical protein IKL89_00785 [Clostridia bacterium]|nr:hypothetical protein [Clostridia bacterium]